jgi:hypothetical protein
MTLSAAGPGHAKFDTKKAHKKTNRIGATPASMARGWISLFVSSFVSKLADALRRATDNPLLPQTLNTQPVASS